METAIHYRGNWVNWLKNRVEIVVPFIGLPLFFAILRGMDVNLNTNWQILICGMAVTYGLLVLWRPQTLPQKSPSPLSFAKIRQAALIVTLGMVLALLIQITLSPNSDSSQKSSLLTLFIFAGIGILGVVAESQIPIDLFPIWRQKAWWRLLYVFIAVLFMTVIISFWGNIFSEFAARTGGQFGEQAREIGSFVDTASQYTPLTLLIGHVISAGIEELVFRAGVLTIVWAITRNWWIGLIISSFVFGLYHINPLNPASTVNLLTPITVVISSFGMGLANGIVYRYRGFTTAVLVHGLGNWLLLMLFLSAQQF